MFSCRLTRTLTLNKACFLHALYFGTCELYACIGRRGYGLELSITSILLVFELSYVQSHVNNQYSSKDVSDGGSKIRMYIQVYM